MIATVISTHNDVECTLDTVESVKMFVGDRIMLMVDGACWPKWQSIRTDAYKVKGFLHGVSKSPYRNMALSLQQAWELWKKDISWLCYTEYDVLFASSRFAHNLKMAEEKNVWMLGNDGHVDDKQVPFIEALVKDKFQSIYYLLGCCQFFHRKFLEKLEEINFFEKFLSLTNQFSPGKFPSYNGYDISEHLYPTLCRHFGGAIGVFATWDHGEWHGAYRYFPMRWRIPITEDFEVASIIHPTKNYDDIVRQYHRVKRGG